MGSVVLGWILIIVGLIILLFGVAGGILKMFAEIKKQGQGAVSGLLQLPDQIIDTLIKFIEALAKAPLWLALIAIGLFLVIFGATML